MAVAVAVLVDCLQDLLVSLQVLQLQSLLAAAVQPRLAVLGRGLTVIIQFLALSQQLEAVEVVAM
jgi:hypothetical protein